MKPEQEIDFSEKKIIIADVDDTICESCQLISEEMANKISNLIKQGFVFAFISGTKGESLQRMISSKLKAEHHILGTTGTNYTLIKNDGSSETIYKYSLSDEEKKEILEAFDKLIEHYNIQSMTTKEDQVQDRDSQITLSAIGRHAPTEAKAAYDPDGKKRLEWVEFLKKYLDPEKYHLKIGGTTSVDITKKGFDKEWGIRKFAEHHNINHANIIFFGDKLHPGGNDFAATKIVDCIAVKNPEDTLAKLNKYFSQEKEENTIIDHRPWGKFEQFTQNEISTVKIIEVLPNKRLSLQSHQNRDELWVALDNNVIVEIDGQQKKLNQGEKVLIKRNSKHRLVGSGEITRVLEISYGNFDEKDIERFEDDFGRV